MSLNHGDLKNTVLPEVSIDEFKPKAGEEVDIIVIAFYLNDKEPAEDLNTFIQRGFIDTLDVEVSPSTDEDGRYLVFVEMERNDTFPNKFQALLKDIKNVTGDIEWKVKTYLSDDKTFSPTDPELFNYVICDPNAYVTKDKFKMSDMKESIEDFFRKSLASNLTINENVIIIAGNNKKIISEVIDVGDYDTVIGRNFLEEAAFKVDHVSFEARVLQDILGNYQVLPIEKYLCINKDDQVMLVKNTQIEYRNL